jgi:hypothetical protein
MSIAAPHVAAFYREVAASRVVWAIQDSGGFPAPHGNGGRRAMPFWSSESRALKIIENVGAYSGFKPVPIQWQAFCDRWVPGLTRDGFRVGINWAGPRATGYDVEPIEVKRNIEVLLNGNCA